MSNTAETGIIYRHECSNPDAYYCAKCDGEKERELQSELTKLRKRVEVLSEALEELVDSTPNDGLGGYQWSNARIVDVALFARQALAESAKIAGDDAWNRETESSGV